LARELFPSNYKPSPTHHFIKLLQDKGLLARCYTQNIDTLERAAGVLPEKLVEAHGSFGSAHCVKCNAEYDMEYMRNKLMNLTDGKKATDDDTKCIPWCACDQADCEGYVKPDIVFFGENLPSRYFTLRESDLHNADLLIVAGTSLKVTPFADTMHYCNVKAPRLLVNRDRVGEVNAFSDVSFMLL
jgi:NAD+-dependent protein deacetylase sirtuin 2